MAKAKVKKWGDLKWIGEEGGPGWEWNCGATKDRKCGCPRPSFWKTVITSPQWKAWEEDQVISMQKCEELGWDSPEAKKYKQRIFDTDECAMCGWIGERHLQEFLTFCASRYNCKGKT